MAIGIKAAHLSNDFLGYKRYKRESEVYGEDEPADGEAWSDASHYAHEAHIARLLGRDFQCGAAHGEA